MAGGPDAKEKSMSIAEKTLFDTSELTVSMGPQHPSTHGVLQVKLKLDGERVLDAECVVGYLHRGVEKLGEVQTWGQWVPTLDRMDYIAAVSNCVRRAANSLLSRCFERCRSFNCFSSSN